MSDKLDVLLELLDLEPLEVNLYRGNSRDIGSGRVFGGQVLAQALVAARRTVEEEREVHSLHGYFILAGDLSAPIVYFVDRLRDGKSFTTRRVTAIQHGRAIFNMAASFHVAEPGLEHQREMPAVPGPDELPDELEMIRARVDEYPRHLQAIYTQDRPIEFRPIEPVDPFHPEPRPPVREMWFRAAGPIEGGQLLHQAVLAYASDYGLLVTSLMPHAKTLQTPGLQIASLDHCMWFHRPVKADEWLLYSMESPSAGGARGFSRGNVFSQSGELVASVAQEGLIRQR